MKTIYKYKLLQNSVFGTEITVSAPFGAKVLCVQAQGNTPFMWMEVDTDNDICPHKFHVIGTGREMGSSMRGRKYIDTFQLDGGSLVFHIFK